MRSQSELKNRNPLRFPNPPPPPPPPPPPILSDFQVPTPTSTTAKAQKRKLEKNLWLALISSVAVYFIAKSLRKETSWVVVVDKTREEEGKKSRSSKEEVVMIKMVAAQNKGVKAVAQNKGVKAVAQNKGVKAVAHDISVTSSSGSRPISKDSIVNLDHGDPTMFESFWRTMGEEGTIVIPGWQTMSYFSDVTNICWFLEPDFAHEIRRLHELVGNAVSEGRHIIAGTGSTQLFQAALYALSPSDAKEPMSVVSAIPYYSSYPAVTDYLRSGLFKWAGDASSFKGDLYIEIVCSPNNPDGFIKQPVLNSNTGKTIHDLAYYWPQYTSISGPANHDIMLFTVSKSTGHAGTRLGWALVKDQDVARRMTKFIELNTIGVSKDSQVRAAKILKVVSDGYELPIPEPTARLFDFGKRNLARRWERLREVAKTTGVFSLPEYPCDTCNFTGARTTVTPAFAWLKCEKDGIEDCESFLKGYKILTRSGRHFGMEAKFVRVSMVDRNETFDLFIERLTSIN